MRRTAKSDARRRYIQHLSASSASASSTSPSSSISTPPRRQQPRRRTAAARKIPSDSSPSTSHLSPLGFDLSPISPSIHDIIQQVQGKQPLQQQRPSSSSSSNSPQQGPSFQVVNRRYERSPSLEITGDRPAPTPPPEEEEEEESPRSSSSNFMGFSPLRGDDTPPPSSATPGQVAMNLVEDSAKDLETVLNVAETGVKSLLSRIRAGEKVIAGTPPPAAHDSSWITNDDNNDNNDDSDAALHDILQEEFNHPPIKTSIGDQRQYNMEMENMYDELVDHNNTPLPPRPRTPPRQHQPLLPPPRAPAPRKPMARIAYKPPTAPPPPPLPISRKRLTPPYPILSPPSMFRDRKKNAGTQMGPIRRANFGTQVGNDRGVHNTLNDIFHDFCTGKKNARQATHKILDIVHQISKDNIR